MKIAILLHGLLRSWEECSTVFSYYSKLYPDVEFDFYLSTWKNALVIPPHKGVEEKFLSNTNLKLKAYSIHDELEIRDNLAPHFTPTINLPVEKLPNYTPQYTFLKSKVCELVKETKVSLVAMNPAILHVIPNQQTMNLELNTQKIHYFVLEIYFGTEALKLYLNIKTAFQTAMSIAYFPQKVFISTAVVG